MKSTENWVRCPNCGHKLFKVVGGEKPSATDRGSDPVTIEIKCHSCKGVSIIEMGRRDVENG